MKVRASREQSQVHLNYAEAPPKLAEGKVRAWLCAFLLIPMVAFGAAGGDDREGVFTGSWRGRVEAYGSSLPLIMTFAADGRCTIDSPEQGIFGVETAVSHNDGDSLKVTIPSIGATIAGRLHGDSLHATYRIMRSSFPIVFTPYDYALVRPQTPQPPYPYATEEVTFHNVSGGASLAGTLTYPADWDGVTAVPVVLMVTGSGQQNRDEEVFGHKPFLVIADHLARHGIASLRYDDRGYGASTGDAAVATTADFAADAAAGVDYLRSRGLFSTVGIIGHSEGGTIAFMLGQQGKADFIISMAGMAVRGDSVLLEQNRQQTGADAITIEEVHDAVAALHNPWLNFFATYSPAQAIECTTCPVLALAGERDTQVDPLTNSLSIQRHLPKNPHSAIIIYPGLNHLFQNCRTGSIAEYMSIEQTIATEVLDDITAWIRGL